MLGRIGLQESMFYQQTVVSKQSFWTEAILGGSRNKMPHLENCLQSPMIDPIDNQPFYIRILRFFFSFSNFDLKILVFQLQKER